MVELREVTAAQWCEFAQVHGPVYFTEPDPDTMDGWRRLPRRVLVVRSTGYATGKKSYFVNDAAIKEVGNE